MALCPICRSNEVPLGTPACSPCVINDEPPHREQQGLIDYLERPIYDESPFYDPDEYDFF